MRMIMVGLVTVLLMLSCGNIISVLPDSSSEQDASTASEPLSQDVKTRTEDKSVGAE